MEYIYTKEIGVEAVAYIKSLGYDKAVLIGSLANIGFSNHDIDILIPLWKIKDRQECFKALCKDHLLNPEYYFSLGYEQGYLENTCFGDINVFFY